MSYQSLKWSILIIPPVAIGLWEYIRHDFLHHWISMDVGNWLASVVVFLAMIAFTFRLFHLMEKNMMQLQQERLSKMLFEEREQVAADLHDGIAQSLFLLSIKLEKQQLDEAKLILNEVNGYVRDSIAHLRIPLQPLPDRWDKYLTDKMKQFREEFRIEASYHWTIPEAQMLLDERFALMRIMNEALLNIVKHASASSVVIHGERVNEHQWTVSIRDNGIGFPEGFGDKPATADSQWSFGTSMMKERCERLGWFFQIDRERGETRLEIRKG